MSDTAAPAAPAAAQPEYTELQRWLTLITVTLATTLYAMTVTIANVALPKMQGTFGATQDEIAWVVTFNIIATAVMTPATGWLAEKVGRRNVMVWGIAVFTLVSAGCGLAESLEQLVFFRILQGLAGAPLVPVSQAIVMTIFPRERHGTALAVWGIGVTIGPIIAPTLGGYVTELYTGGGSSSCWCRWAWSRSSAPPPSCAAGRSATRRRSTGPASSRSRSPSPPSS